MRSIDKNRPPAGEEVADFLHQNTAALPDGLVDFYKEANGATIFSEDLYTVIWPITEILEQNIGYDVEEFAPEFMIFGSDGGGTAFAIEKSTGKIFQMPFIGMGRDSAEFLANTFPEFIHDRY